MAAQQIQIAETIRAMKLALKRRPDDSESDEEMHGQTNRGNKLKRRARHVREGRLDTSGGLAHRKRVNHAGYTRATISVNPRMYDSDGEPFSPLTSDGEHERYATPVEDNPFGEVRLETLLKPLTAAHELAQHPSLSAPFKSKALTEMAAEAEEMLRRERHSLWKAKTLLRRFRGDGDWVPLEIFETPTDDMLLHHYPGESRHGAPSAPALVVEHMMDVQEDVPSDPREAESYHEGEATNGVEATDMAQASTTANNFPAHSGEGPPTELSTGATAVTGEMQGGENTPTNNEDQGTATKVEGADDAETNGEAVSQLLQNPTVNDLRQSAEVASSDSGSNAGSANMHAMTTRARARSPHHSDSPSPSPSDSASVPSIHPWFLAPNSSLPDRDLGLPPAEAEETRKLLLLYCQKQEQIIRSLEALYNGVQKADRLGKFVMASAKASEHMVLDSRGNAVTAMSDGEDWYDYEELGNLEKGKDEVEDVEEEARRGARRRRVHNKVM